MLVKPEVHLFGFEFGTSRGEIDEAQAAAVVERGEVPADVVLARVAGGYEEDCAVVMGEQVAVKLADDIECPRPILWADRLGGLGINGELLAMPLAGP